MKLARILVFALAPFAASAYQPAATFEASAGELPLILTVPHDGVEPLDAIAPRSKGVTVRDMDAKVLAERVASALQQRTGKRPYLVVAKFSRKYLDANRPEDEAMESAEALPAYRAYHDQVTAYVAELKAKYPRGALLVDVHGQGTDANTTFRGTRAGLTTKRLVERFGVKAIQGPDSIIGVLAAKGATVDPAVDAASLSEHPGYTGGYTVFHYGSNNSDGIDAIQLEFGLSQRQSARFAEDVADALVTFMQSYQYLPK